jgi:hypothetical protein
MQQRPKIFYSEGQKAIMWDRWQRGESLANIARLFDRNHSAIQGILSKSGTYLPFAAFDAEQRHRVTRCFENQRLRLRFSCEGQGHCEERY